MTNKYHINYNNNNKINVNNNNNNNINNINNINNKVIKYKQTNNFNHQPLIWKSMTVIN